MVHDANCGARIEMLSRQTGFSTFLPRCKREDRHHIRRVLGLHTSGHDSAAAIVEDGEVLEVIEFERVFREKRCRIFPGSMRFDRALEWLFRDYGVDPQFDLIAVQTNCFREQAFETAIARLDDFTKTSRHLLLNHHLCHAASAYFTSPFSSAVILSYDGIGNDGTTVGFLARGSRLEYTKSWPCTLGMAYRALGSIIGGISEFDNHTAGKTMGLTAYGSVVEEWKEPIKHFIRNYWPLREEVASWEPTVADGAFFLEGFGPVSGRNTFGGPQSAAGQDFAKTFQVCWTELVLECIRELVETTGCRNLCITGGAALNAVTNRAILDMPELDSVHFIPNCNDAGIAMGAALYGYYGWRQQPWRGAREPFSPFKGVPILDRNEVSAYAASRGATKLSKPVRDLAKILADGHIIGILQGRSEVGPRALGNRSIVCDPRDPIMKNVLNERVKGREWFRPFAPVVRIEDLREYFDLEVPLPYMSAVGFTRERWRGQLGAITHVDGSARVQTVSCEQNRFLWELLAEMKRLTSVGVLLNTSFNGKGEPMITQLKDALRLLDTTGLEDVYCDGWLFHNRTSRQCSSWEINSAVSA